MTVMERDVLWEETGVWLSACAPALSRASRVQAAAIRTHAKLRWLLVPAPEAEWAPGRVWGYFDACFTAAFWALQAWQRRLLQGSRRRHALGDNLREEVAACLLGGHGMPAEVGLAAFNRLRSERQLTRTFASPKRLERLLREPLTVNGRQVRYRFPVVKAKQLSQTMSALSARRPPTNAIALRDWLRTLPGIGPKTASWIVRNRDAHARVAILDVHVIRACQILGLFPQRVQLPRDYDRLEAAFLWFSDQLRVLPGDLDAAMWHEMRVAPALVDEAIESSSAATEAPLDCQGLSGWSRS